MPYVLLTNDLPKLTLLRDPPEKNNNIFRLECPVLIISATWLEITIPYGQTLRNALIRRYVGFEDSVSAPPRFRLLRALTHCRSCLWR